MPGRIDTPSHPVSLGGGGARLRWWAVALPVLAFVCLFLLVLNPAQAHAATDTPGLTRLIELIRMAMTG